jgi:hypothetical protein
MKKSAGIKLKLYKAFVHESDTPLDGYMATTNRKPNRTLK